MLLLGFLGWLWLWGWRGGWVGHPGFQLSPQALWRGRDGPFSRDLGEAARSVHVVGGERNPGDRTGRLWRFLGLFDHRVAHRFFVLFNFVKKSAEPAFALAKIHSKERRGLDIVAAHFLKMGVEREVEMEVEREGYGEMI